MPACCNALNADRWAAFISFPIRLDSIGDTNSFKAGSSSTESTTVLAFSFTPKLPEGPAKLWTQGLEAFDKSFIKEQVDLNNIPTIKNGIIIIQNKMHSAEVAEAAKREASKYAEDGGGQEFYNKALDILGVNK